MVAILDVRLTPRAAQAEVGPWRGDRLAVRVVAPPEKGRANEELCLLLADRLGIPKGRLQMVQGSTRRLKRVAVQGLS